MTNKICEVCGLPYEYSLRVTYNDGEKACLHDSPEIGHVSKIAKRRKENEERSRIAHQQAAEYSSSHPEHNVTVRRPKDAGGVTPHLGNPVESVPSSVIESLKEKAIFD